MEQDKTLIDYEKNLQELDRQREKLEIALQMMGQEWEESGAGIGWLGSLDLPVIQQQQDSNTTPNSGSDDISITTTNTIATTKDNKNIQSSLEPALFTNILSSNTGPSPEYLQSLLHVNETLLVQSLANTTNISMLTPVNEDQLLLINTNNSQLSSNSTPPINSDTPTTNYDPESELIISTLSTTTNNSLIDNKISLLSNTTTNHHIQF
jgi:hypothetical protein